MSERRVVVTGLGIINAAGIGSLQVHEAVTNGQCFLRPITRFNAENFPVQLASPARLQTPEPASQFIGNFSVLGVDASAKSFSVTACAVGAHRHRLGMVPL